MKFKRVGIALALLACALGAGWYWLKGGWRDGGGARVKPLSGGHQEVAWIAPATGSESWERLVAALQMLAADWNERHETGKLTLNLKNAFLHLTADVPEIGLHFGDAGQTLWLRWYKLSGENTAASWVEKLVARGQPPLAIVGGETTDRAVSLGKELEASRSKWSGPAPLFLITTATADSLPPSDDRAGAVPYDQWPRLMDVYAGRSFRYSFTNTRMVEAIMDFVRQNPHVCARRSSDPLQLGALTTLGDPWASLAHLGALGHTQPWFMYAFSWWDDSYSRDMAHVFSRHFEEHMSPHDDGEPAPCVTDQVDYSVGEYNQVNISEARAVARLLNQSKQFKNHHHLLVLPTGAQRVRRFVRDFCRQAPAETRNFVIISGDSITFNHVFRDRETAWNILEMPAPLVFFSHRMPVDEGAGFRWAADDNRPGARTSTQDLLLHRDVIESLLLACYSGTRLLSDADAVMPRLRQTHWSRGRVYHPQVKDHAGIALFDDLGNRRPGTGEHIIWVQPIFDGERNLHRAGLSIWGTNAKDTHRWFIRPTVAPPVTVSYNHLGPVLVHRDLERWMLRSSAHSDPGSNPLEVEVHEEK